jgi:hypothetical protein
LSAAFCPPAYTGFHAKQAGIAQANFIETMDCLPVSKPPNGPGWTYEIKLDGYRLEVVRKSRMTTLYSRRDARNAVMAIGVGGLIAGTLDIAQALTLFGKNESEATIIVLAESP